MIPQNFILFKLEDVLKEINEQFLIDEVVEILRKNESRIEQFNRSQLLSGKKGDDTLMPNYADGRGRVKLFDTGEFQSKIFIELNNESILLYSEDDKTESLVARYGENIFGLNSKNLAKTVEQIIRPELVERIQKKIDAVI